MRPNAWLPALCCLILLLAGASPAEARRADADDPHFTYTGDDDARAAVLLGRFLEARGLEVDYHDGNILAVTVEGAYLGLQPVTLDGGLDHLVATVGFPVREGVKESELAAIAAKLNRTTLGIQYSVRPNGLLAQFFVSFVDQISYEEIEAAFTFQQHLQVATVLAAPELIALLDR